ncbi:MAG: cardiolipin synthase [Silicimonas sp.]
MGTFLIVAAGVLLQIALVTSFALRALLRPDREPSSRVAWILVILILPVVGIGAYVLFGETNIGWKRIRAYQRVADQLETAAARVLPASPRFEHLFRIGTSISGFNASGGNAARLLPDSNATIDAIIEDMDAARDHVHMLFYIWLADTNGLKVVDAACRAAQRGVTVRAMADDLGSRKMIRSGHWKRMEAAGVRLARALPVDHPLFHPIRGRVDLRNHRKIVVIDGAITYCGSQNCADPEFRVKPKYAPWVDLMVRFEGPVALQNQKLFAQDWMVHTDEDLTPLLRQAPADAARPGIVAQVVGTGPTVRASAMPEMFEVLMHAARRELVVTTPYYVPSESMQAAFCATARRGVDTVLVVPRRNDSFVVAAASRSYYPELRDAGVRIFEYRGGLLHTKSLTLDGQVSLIGSANLDRRSFDLNYENNILLEDADLTAAIRERQESYIRASVEVSAEDIAGWSARRRAWYNAVAMMGPVL